MFEQENQEPILVALYKRVSTDDQAREGHSLDEQENIMRKFCEIQGYKVYRVYSDEGFSGKETTKRKQFNKMMSDMKAHKFKKIIALKLDRITRDLYDFVSFTRTTDKYNCGFEFVLEKFDTTSPSGRMILNILGVFAQFEREMIRERTLIGVQGAVNRGHFGGPAPLGYKKETESKLLVIDEETAPIVKEIFDLCLKGYTYTSISKIMKDKYGDMSLNRKDKKTGEKYTIKKGWTDSSIGTILNNKMYYGVWEHRRKVKDAESVEISGFIPPIITKEVFDECQECIKRNARNYYRNKPYLFLQKLVCPKCGCIMACAGTKKPNGKEYLYYKCKECKTYFNEDLVETALVERLTTLFELYTALEQNYVMVDDNFAKIMNENKLEDKIRFTLDAFAIERKYMCGNGLFSRLWDMAPHDIKCRFIHEYIDTIQIKTKKRSKNKITELELPDLTIRPYKISELMSNGMGAVLKDIAVDTKDEKYNICEMNSRKKADDYISKLSKIFNIRVIDELKDKDEYYGHDLFRIIKIKSNRAVEPDNTLYLELIR
ncbi:MAG: recombinase family protein [Firmicutes bacterium]|nr:recombinase family protein [Bacillota bacterium]